MLLQAKLVQCVKSLSTVEEKLYHVNKPKYYGWQSVIVEASRIQPTSLEFAQYVTNTTTVDNELPPLYKLKTSSGKELDLLDGKHIPIFGIFLVFIVIRYVFFGYTYRT